MSVIITKKLQFVNEDDRCNLNELTNTFKEFKKHNFNTMRSIKKFYEYNRDRNWSFNDKGLAHYYSANKQKRIQCCNNWGEFVKFLDGNKEVKQTKSNACGTHLLCPFCASRKASKIQKRVEDFFYLFTDDIEQKTILTDVEQIINNEFEIKPSEHTVNVKNKVEQEHGNILNYHWYYMVLTVKNDFDIDKGLGHIRNSFEAIRNKIKNHKRGLDKLTAFKILGAVYSIEITYNPKTGFHPHINIMCAFDERIPDIKAYPRKKLKLQTNLMYNSKLISDEWLSITGDSYITSCTPLPVSKDNHGGLKKHLMEILKYSLKFNSMDTDIMIELYPHLYKKRLFGSLGFMYGLGLDKLEIEEFVTDRKYQEFVMNYVDGIYKFDVKEEKHLEVHYVDKNGQILYDETLISIPVQSTKDILQYEPQIELRKLTQEFEKRRDEY